MSVVRIAYNLILNPLQQYHDNYYKGGLRERISRCASIFAARARATAGLASFVVATVATGAVAMAAREDAASSNQAEVAFGRAILTNYLSALPLDQQCIEIENFQASDPAQLEKFPRLIFEQLTRCSVQPNVANTPAFLHSSLGVIQELRDQFQSLKDKDRFSLLSEPSNDQSQEMRNVVFKGRNIVGRVFCSPNIMQRYAPVMAEAATGLVAVMRSVT
jgi:hypothetical protein